MFGNRLKELRIDSDLTQEQLAKYINITRSALANYETELREPGYVILIKIADYFNSSLDYLLCRTNVNTPFKK